MNRPETGTSSRFDVSTISLALAKLNDRCLSLKTGTARPSCSKTCVDLAKELISRIEDLPLFVAGVIAVFADDQDGVDGQFLAAAAEGLGDRGIDLEAKIAGSLGTLVILRVSGRRRGRRRRSPADAISLARDSRPGTGRPCAGRGKGSATRS